MDCKHEHNSSGTPGFWRSRSGIGLIVMGGVAGYFLVTEHLAHVIGVLPYLLLLACPLMHVFMHGGHGGHGHGGNSDDSNQSGHCSHGQHHDTKKPDEKSEPTDKGDRS
nr:DUF2933 domain-containing protein [uncultured Tolumonas sp.]